MADKSVYTPVDPAGAAYYGDGRQFTDCWTYPREKIDEMVGTSLDGIETAKQDAISAVQEAGSDAVQEIEAKGEETLESIPDDYTQLSEDVSELKSDLNSVKDELGLNATLVIPDGYKTINYENSSNTMGMVYANDSLTIYLKVNAGSVSASNFRITNSHIGITPNSAVAFAVTADDNIALKFNSSVTDNGDKWRLEFRFYNSDFSGQKGADIPLSTGEKENVISLSELIASKSIDISTYPNAVIFGIACGAHTATVDETASVEILGFFDANVRSIVDRVEALENKTVAYDAEFDSIEHLLQMDLTEPSSAVDLTSPNTGYLTDNGTIVVDSHYGYTDLIPCVAGADYKFVAFIFGNASLVWYDSTGTVVSGINGSTLGGDQFTTLTFTQTAPVNASYYRLSHYINDTKPFTVQQLTDVDTRDAITKLKDADEQFDILPSDDGMEIYFACGDSITHANHNGVAKIDLDDPYMPSGGTEGYIYNTKNYAYYLSKRNYLKWYNYGIGGSTLTQCSVNGDVKNGFATPNGRYTQFAENVAPDYISILFGWNDKTWGPIQQREIWLTETYGTSIYYPLTAADIGGTAQDGTPFATQAQKDACDAVTGEVGGVTYNTSAEYFYAKFISTIDDTDPRTWYGAWNTVLNYLILKYPYAKIMPIVPYSYTSDADSIDGINLAMKQAVRNVAEKWGLAYFDFDSEDHQNFLATCTTTFITSSEHLDVKDLRRDTLLADMVHPNNYGYKYMANMIGTKLMSI